MSRERWLEAAKLVLSGSDEEIPCPVDCVGYLEVEWIPFENRPGGEFRLSCRECGAENFVLKRIDPAEPDHPG